MANTSRRLFTSESVTEGHPDKICDAISDSVLDAMLEQDPSSRVAVETMVTTGQVHVAGEVTTTAQPDINQIVRNRILEIGYDSSAKGFDGTTCGVNIAIGAQSPDIAQGVDTAYEKRVESAEDEIAKQGAGDQGMMFGYACMDTPELMPLPIALAHRLSRRLTEVRKNGTLPYLRADGKTQVTIAYDGEKPSGIENVVVSSQHAADVDLDGMLTPDILQHVVTPEVEALGWDPSQPQLLVNPTGRFVTGGPMGDAGLTGRKIIVDTYGGMGRHGGGAFSGKDPSKVDRSAAYAMRWVAKNAVAAGLAPPDRGPGRLRDRQGRPGRPVRGDVRHRERGPGEDPEGDRGGLRPASGRDHPRPEAAPPDLHADRRVRPLRPDRRRAAVGGHLARRRAEVRRRFLIDALPVAGSGSPGPATGVSGPVRTPPSGPREGRRTEPVTRRGAPT